MTIAAFSVVATTVSAAQMRVRAQEDECRRAKALSTFDRAKTAFFSNVSHEFRTPLTLMLGPLEQSLAKSEHLPDDERERVRRAYLNGQRLLKPVNTLLEFSRIEEAARGRFSQPTDLANHTAELASQFE